ncbi:MAG TPA: hypothetical protein VNI58_00830 [Mariprofundaceae bacterium]|nr:hypothetical protein [Mariprofundaceae bacterium]
MWIGLSGESGEIESVCTEVVISWKSDDDISTCGELIRPHVGIALLQPLVLSVVD